MAGSGIVARVHASLLTFVTSGISGCSALTAAMRVREAAGKLWSADQLELAGHRFFVARSYRENLQ
jgi:hypothetical protein